MLVILKKILNANKTRFNDLLFAVKETASENLIKLKLSTSEKNKPKEHLRKKQSLNNCKLNSTF